MSMEEVGYELEGRASMHGPASLVNACFVWGMCKCQISESVGLGMETSGYPAYYSG